MLPDALAIPLSRLEQYGMAILIGLLFVLPMLGAQLDMDLDIFRWLLGGPVNAIITIILQLTGNA